MSTHTDIGIFRLQQYAFQAQERKTHRKGTDNGPSNGLGLILCKNFIEKHGGKIWAKSEEGHCSTFNFSIP